MGFYCTVLIYNFFFQFSFHKAAAKRIIVSKFGACTGQACIAIDYVLVEEAFTFTLIWIYRKFLMNFFYGKKKKISSLFIYLFYKYIILSRKIYWNDFFSFLTTSVELMKVHINQMFGENPMETNSIVKIINKQHFSRLKNLLCDPNVKDSIV